MKSKAETQLNIETIRKWGPCYDPARYLAEDWHGTILDILRMEQVPVVDRIWCGIRALDDKQRRLFACWCARQALKLIPEGKVDPRSVNAIEVTERYAHGEAAHAELIAARSAAWSAADAARSAAWSASVAARFAARSAAWSAADAARSAAWSAAVAARNAQLKHLIEILEGDRPHE